MDYIFDKSYSQALTKLVGFIDSTKSWDLIKKLTLATNDTIVNELLEKNDLADLDSHITTQLLQDIKFMGEFDTPEEREAKFKQHYCSSRLFSHYKDEQSEQMCQSAFNAVVNADGWDYLKNFDPNPETGFMFNSDPQMNRLMDAIDRANPIHSGFSMGWTMRQLEQVAKSGCV